MLKKIKHTIEAGVVFLLFTALRQFSLDTASAIGGWMARAIGPFLSVHKTAGTNLSRAFPDMSETDKHRILTKMWDNLGRVAAELAHIPKGQIQKRIKISGAEHMPAHGIPAFIFSGHIGNWELFAPMANLYGRPLTIVYREANNPMVDGMVAKIRSDYCFNIIPKGRQGAPKIIRAIKNNELISMLVDQKMNDGIPIPFFGEDVMTAPAIAELALRYDAPIIPSRIVRTGSKEGKNWGAHFEIIVYPPLKYEKTGDKTQDIQNIMLAINRMLESWIREHPEQWFWVHKRWPKEDT